MSVIKIHLTLQELEALNDHFMRYIMHHKISSIVTFQCSGEKSRDETGKLSRGYTLAVIMVVIIDQVNLLVLQKLLNWQTVKKREGKLSMDEAQAIVFYHALQAVPTPKENVWLWMLGNKIVGQIDQQLDVDAMLSNLKNTRIEIH